MTTVMLIDGENISWKYALELHSMASAIGHWSSGGIYGNTDCMKEWRPYSQAWLLPERQTGKEKQAADQMLCEDATKFYTEGKRIFILAANDGGYAKPAEKLCQGGAQIFGIGNKSQFSQKLLKAYTDFFVIGKDSAKEIKRRVQKHQSEALSPPLGTKTKKEALDVLKQHDEKEPDSPHRVQLLGFFLQHIYQQFCFPEEGSWLLGQGPNQSIGLLEQLGQDTLFSSMLVGERKKQWSQIQTFAEQCQQAYQQGYQAATTPFSSPLFTPTQHPFEHNDERNSLHLWFRYGYRTGREDLQKKEHHVWSCWYEER